MAQLRGLRLGTWVGMLLVVLLVGVVAIAGLALMSLGRGNVFSSLTSNLPPGSGGASPHAEADLSQVAERLIIRTGSISMIVNDVHATQQAIEQMVTEMADEGAGDFLIFFGIAVLPWLLFFGLATYGVWRFIAWVRARRNREKPVIAAPPK